MALPQNYKKALDKTLPQMCEDLDVHYVLPHLIADGYFSDSDREELEAVPVRRDKVMRFISILKRRGMPAFEIFYKTLGDSEGSKHLADLLHSAYNVVQESQSSVPVQATT